MLPTTSQDRCLPKHLRVRRRSKFRHVQAGGVRVHTEHFLVIQAAGESLERRIGITVTKKVGHAVARNRVKRLVREFFRHHRTWFVEGVDIVVIAKRGAPKLNLARIEEELKNARGALHRAGKRARKASLG